MVNYSPRFYNENRFPPRPNISPEKQSNKIFWIIGVFILILIGVLLYLVFIVPFQDKDNKLPNEDDINASNVHQNISNSLTECESDIDCFINKTNKCDLASFTYNFTINLFGWIQDHSYYYEIKGKKNDNCTLYMKLKNVYGKYDEATRQAFLDTNMSESEIDQQEQEMNNALRDTINSDGTCSIPQKKLTKMFTDLKSGDMSSDTWDMFNCTGKLFNSESAST